MKIPYYLIPLAFLPLLGCQNPAAPRATPAAEAPLKDAAAGLFNFGAAINAGQITGDDKAGVALVKKHFDSITPENALKWERVHPAPDRYDFELTDQLVKMSEREGLQLIGHTLMWHSQTPDWVFENADGTEISREDLLLRLQDHIRTIVGRYRGKIHGWDVVNEAIRDEDGALRTDKPWYRILGEEGIFAAFAAAHEADPDAELYYNDYAVENPAKRAGIIKLAKAIRDRGLRIDGVGSQGHYGLDWPEIDEIDASLNDLAEAGFKVMYTELDVTVLPRPMNYFGAEISTVFTEAPELDPYRAGLPAAIDEELARRYSDIFAVFAKHKANITRVTLWGVTDSDSWLNNWPIRGRTDYAMLFDREAQPKAAVKAVRAVLEGAQAER